MKAERKIRGRPRFDKEKKKGERVALYITEENQKQDLEEMKLNQFETVSDLYRHYREFYFNVK